ncbi:MAG: DEAD/DEAH box helicase [Baekduia sp.]
MELATADDRPNLTIRRGPDGRPIVVIAFAYDPAIVHRVRQIPRRRFEWETREWWVPVDVWTGLEIRDLLRRYPDLTTSTEVAVWLRGIEDRWIAELRTTIHDGRGWFVVDTRAGELPELLADAAIEQDGRTLVPMTMEIAELLDEERGVKTDGAARRCISAALIGEVPRARLELRHDAEGMTFGLQELWDPDTARAFMRLGTDRSGTLPLDPWIVAELDGFLARHDVPADGPAAAALEDLREEAAAAQAAIRRSQATDAEPIAELDAVLGGTLQPFQWAGVRYLLDTRRAFLADEQGLGKTVQALAALEADDRWPAVVVCPASLKLNWERETRKWLPHRSVTVVAPGVAVPPEADITIVNYEMVGRHRETLTRRGAQALVVDESHYAKNPRAKRTQEIRRLAASMPADALVLALSGTPVLNHPEELISQLRMIGRMEEFGSGASFKREFQGAYSEDRLHWHLRRRCFIRRLKSEVLPQLPAKRQVIVPVSLDNEPEYRLAEKDLIAWLREQPLSLSSLDAKIAATLRAQRLAQLTALQRIAARGKLHAALTWIHDFLASEEPLVVFARHVEIQGAVLDRFPDALHLLGRDSVEQREAAVQAFQDPEGPHLIVCATRVAAQGITLTRASNVCFLEQEWTPALHDQAEDRCHRIGQHDAVTAWYLLAAETIDETMAEILAKKRGIIDAVTDGKAREDDETVVQGVLRAMRAGPTYRHLSLAQ